MQFKKNTKLCNLIHWKYYDSYLQVWKVWNGGCIYKQ